MNYETKYFRYKQKYLDLKQRIMMGGALPFDKHRFFHVIAKLGGETLNRVQKRREALGITTNHDNLHMTFLSLIFNYDNKLYHSLFDDEDFCIKIIRLFKSIIRKYSVQFVSLDDTDKKGVWEIFGRSGKEYFARVYKVDASKKEFIKVFRQAVIKEIEKKLGLSDPKIETRGTANDSALFIIYSTSDGKELFAINAEHYGDVETWKPHISIFSREEIKKISGTIPIAKDVNDMFEDITNQGPATIADKIIQKIGNAADSISKLFVNGDKRNDFDELRISHRGYGGKPWHKDYQMFGH